MDDGAKAGKGFLFHTDSFTKSDVERLIEVINSKFGLHANIRARKPGQYAIYIPIKDRELFLNLISKFVVNSMRYKIQ